MRILLADDHTVIRKGLICSLSQAYPQAIIEEVSNGIDLLQSSINQHWDIIISDISMPGKTGLEVLNELKEKGSRIPVIILSVHSPELYALKCIKSGAFGYLTKESAPDLLVTAINHILSTNKKYITQEIAILLAGILENDSTGPIHEKLSKRELEVFKQIAIGNAGKKIAETLAISVGTVSTYRTRILEKMGMNTNADITRYAFEKHLIIPQYPTPGL